MQLTESLFRTLTYLWITIKTSKSSWKNKPKTGVRSNKKKTKTRVMLRLLLIRLPTKPVRKRLKRKVKP